MEYCFDLEKKVSCQIWKEHGGKVCHDFRVGCQEFNKSIEQERWVFRNSKVIFRGHFFFKKKLLTGTCTLKSDIDKPCYFCHEKSTGIFQIEAILNKVTSFSEVGGRGDFFNAKDSKQFCSTLIYHTRPREIEAVIIKGGLHSKDRMDCLKEKAKVVDTRSAS